MSWLIIAIIAYFLLALVNIGDKLFLGNFVPNYKAYSALVAILGMVVFVIAPWFLSWPGTSVFILSLVSGALFILALITFFFSLQVGQASRVIPFIGGLVPIFSLGFSYVLLSERLGLEQLVAFALLIIGTVIMVRLPHKTHWWTDIWEKIHPTHDTKELLIAVCSSILFAGSFVSTKLVYEQTDFFNGFLWIRLGSFIVGLLLITNPATRKAFVNTIKSIPTKQGGLFITNQLFGAGGFLLQSFAISLGSVALVNALQGVQYVFVIILAAIASIFFPKLAGDEDIDIKIIIEKIFAALIIGGGLWLLAVNA